MTRTSDVSVIASISKWRVPVRSGAATTMFCIRVVPHHTCTCKKKPSRHATNANPRSSPLIQACHCRPGKACKQKGGKKFTKQHDVDCNGEDSWKREFLLPQHYFNDSVWAKTKGAKSTEIHKHVTRIV